MRRFAILFSLSSVNTRKTKLKRFSESARASPTQPQRTRISESEKEQMKTSPHLADFAELQEPEGETKKMLNAIQNLNFKLIGERAKLCGNKFLHNPAVGWRSRHSLPHQNENGIAKGEKKNKLEPRGSETRSKSHAKIYYRPFAFLSCFNFFLSSLPSFYLL